MGVCRNRGLANVVKADPEFLMPVPDEWSLEDAASVMAVYLTIACCFHYKAYLKRGESVLIHGAAGGLGQACIHYCLFYGCEIFATVGSQEKRNILKKLFPQLRDDHIGCSRDTSFEEMIMTQTNGRGVDIVMNSLSDDKLHASLRCLAPRGRFLELGKFDIANNTLIGFNCMENDRAIHSITPYITAKTKYAIDYDVQRILTMAVKDGIKIGAIKPLSTTIFNIDETEKAIRYFATSKHTGKILIKIRDEEPDIRAPPTPLLIKAIPRHHFNPDATYVVIGGMGGFGLEMIDWMVVNGARKIVINSRRGITTGYQAYRINIWKSYEAQIEISTDDVSTLQGCTKLLQLANALGPVMGIFNLAVLLKDGLFENQSPEQFLESFKPKAIATRYLDIESRRLCPQLMSFVVFSSVVGGRGNAGQTNYGMANSVMERICEERRREHLPALAVEWGAVGEVGLVADMAEDNLDLEISGTLQQKIADCLEVFGRFLNNDEDTIVSSIVVAEKKQQLIGGMTLVSAVANIMNIEPKTVSKETPIAELGIDSLMAIEIKQCLERNYVLFLAPNEIRTLTFARLDELSNEMSPQPKQDKKVTGTDLTMLFKAIVKEEHGSGIVDLPTLHSNDDSDVPHLFIVPGIEGVTVGFESFCKRLKCTATVLQMGFTHCKESPHETAKRLLGGIRERIKKERKYALLAYSYGSLIALEMAKILEDEGYSGQLFLVDGSPRYLHAIAANETRDDATMQTLMLDHVRRLVAPESATMLRELSALATFEEKVAAVSARVADSAHYSAAYMSAVLTTLYARIVNVREWHADDHAALAACRVVLLRIKDMPGGFVIENDYDLQRYTAQPVEVHILDADHSSVLDHRACPNVVNESLMAVRGV